MLSVSYGHDVLTTFYDVRYKYFFVLEALLLSGFWYSTRLFII